MNQVYKFAQRKILKIRLTGEMFKNSVAFRVQFLGNGQWDIPKRRELLQEIVSEDTDFENFI